MNLPFVVTKERLKPTKAGLIGKPFVNVPQRRGDDVLFAQDEGIKSDSNVETLAKLKPVQ